MRRVIIIPGLGHGVGATEVAVKWWEKEGFRTKVFKSNWESEESYEDKLKRLVRLIDRLGKIKKVALVGISAGGSLGLNAFLEKKEKVRKMVVLCGRTNMKRSAIFWWTERMTLKNVAYKASVRNFMGKETTLTKADKKKIMTVRSKFWDQYVAKRAGIIEGVKNIELPAMGHVLTISAGLTGMSEEVRGFLK